MTAYEAIDLVAHQLRQHLRPPLDEADAVSMSAEDKLSDAFRCVGVAKEAIRRDREAAVAGQTFELRSALQRIRGPEGGKVKDRFEMSERVRRENVELRSRIKQIAGSTTSEVLRPTEKNTGLAWRKQLAEQIAAKQRSRDRVTSYALQTRRLAKSGQKSARRTNDQMRRDVMPTTSCRPAGGGPRETPAGHAAGAIFRPDLTLKQSHTKKVITDMVTRELQLEETMSKLKLEGEAELKGNKSPRPRLDPHIARPATAAKADSQSSRPGSRSSLW